MQYFDIVFIGIIHIMLFFYVFSVLQSNNKTQLIKVCIFVKESLEVRISILNARML